MTGGCTRALGAMAMAGLAAAGSLAVCAQSTVNATNKWAWSAGAGWINCRTDPTNGACIGEFVCSGYVWSASAGWINLGGGAPTNGIRYSNLSASDFGVNHDGGGSLRGYAWCPSTGWLNFEATGAPCVDLRSGVLMGYAWGGSLGWISFTNIQGHVRTDAFHAGADTDRDGLPDAWERVEAGSLGLLSATNDFDGDGASDGEEYMAGTHPRSHASVFAILELAAGPAGPRLRWTCDPSRLYRVETSESPPGKWQNSAAGTLCPTSGPDMSVALTATNAAGWYRVKAFRPPSP